MFCKEAQTVMEGVYMDESAKYLKYNNHQKGARIFTYYMPNTFHRMDPIVSNGTITNCHHIAHYYLHGYESRRNDIISESLIEYLEDGKLKLIEMRKLSSDASAMFAKHNYKKTKNKNKMTKHFFAEQITTRRSGIIILKCAMEGSNLSQKFHIYVLNLFHPEEIIFYEGGPTVYTFYRQDTANLKSLKLIFETKLGIKRVLSAFLVVNREPQLLTKKEVKNFKCDELYSHMVDKYEFPIKSSK